MEDEFTTLAPNNNNTNQIAFMYRKYIYVNYYKLLDMTCVLNLLPMRLFFHVIEIGSFVVH